MQGSNPLIDHVPDEPMKYVDKANSLALDQYSLRTRYITIDSLKADD